MKQFIDKKQKIVATCILQKGNKIFLLRGSQLTNATTGISDTGYFDVPRFEINFGDNPELVIKEYFNSYFDHFVTSIEVADVRENIIEEQTIQIFEIIYKIQCDKVLIEHKKQGVFFFADVLDLTTFMLSDQYEHIIPYLEESNPRSND